MKSILKSTLFALCLFCFASVSSAYVSSRFDGAYFSVSTSGGAIVGVEATIDGNYIYGTVLTRDGDDPYFYGEDVDNTGHFDTRLRSDGRGATVSGRVSGAILIVTVKSVQGTATFICVKANGYAPTFIAGKYFEIYFHNSLAGGSYFYVELDCDYLSQTYASTYQYSNSHSTDYGYKNYTYRKTGPNTVTITVAGFGTYRLTFTSS